MAAPLTISSINSSYLLEIPDVFPSALLLQGYNVDNAFDTEQVEPVEVQIGVDGLSGAAYLPYLIKQSISFLANSPSIQIFDAWAEAMRSAREAYPANGKIIIPSIGRIYTARRGWLTAYSPVSDAKKALEGRTFGITWEKLTPMNG